jgi:hypothetical protein
MVSKLPDELLPDHSGRAENAYVDSFCLHDEITSASCLRVYPVCVVARPPALKKKPAGLFGPAGVVIPAVSSGQLRDNLTHPRPADSLRPLSANRLVRGAHRHDWSEYTG